MIFLFSQFWFSLFHYFLKFNNSEIKQATRNDLWLTKNLTILNDFNYNSIAFKQTLGMVVRLVVTILIVLSSQQIISARFVLIRLKNGIKDMNDSREDINDRFVKARQFGSKKQEGNVYSPHSLTLKIISSHRYQRIS